LAGAFRRGFFSAEKAFCFVYLLLKISFSYLRGQNPDIACFPDNNQFLNACRKFADKVICFFVSFINNPAALAWARAFVQWLLGAKICHLIVAHYGGTFFHKKKKRKRVVVVFYYLNCCYADFAAYYLNFFDASPRWSDKKISKTGKSLKEFPMTANEYDNKTDGFSSEGEKIEERERAFTKAMVESLPGSFSINDANGQLVWWNAYHRDEIVGKDESEMCYTNALEVFHPDDRALAAEKMLNVLNLGIEETSEGRVLLRGGPKYQWRMITGKRIMIDGNPFVVAVGIDVTERKQFEVIMEFRLRLLEMAENSSPEELLKATLDEAERLTESSIGFFNIISDDQMTFSTRISSVGTEIRMQVFEGKRDTLFLNEEEILADAVQQRRAVIDNTYGASTNCCGEVNVHTDKRILFIPLMRGGTVTALLCIAGKSYDYDENDSMMAGALANLAWDIVSRKRAELMEQKIQEVLLQAQKMELVSQLAGGIAHDFNNMLGVILGNVEMAMNRHTLEETLLSNMKAILKATEHSADLTSQLLAFSRKQAVMPIVLNLNTMIERMLAILRRLIGENISLVWKPEPMSTPVKIDPSQVDLMLGNLCINSRDAIHGIGKITIETSRIHVEKAQCISGHSCKEPGDYVMLAVTDTGCGIEKKDLPHIFEPFFTTKEKRKGTGMGLSTVYGIVKQNNAFIECLSEPGRGTTFNIYLPRHIGYADRDGSEQPTQPFLCSKEMILLVEDEPDILNICKLMLENKGYAVLDAATPSDAIGLAREHKGIIHLLITDVVLPEMNGCDLSRKLQSIFPDLKTLFMSGYTTEVVGGKGVLELGVNFIQKPFSINTLVFAIQKIFSLA
jgi:PAS domain S-box-containing protein